MKIQICMARDSFGLLNQLNELSCTLITGYYSFDLIRMGDMDYLYLHLFTYSRTLPKFSQSGARLVFSEPFFSVKTLGRDSKSGGTAVIPGRVPKKWLIGFTIDRTHIEKMYLLPCNEFLDYLTVI